MATLGLRSRELGEFVGGDGRSIERRGGESELTRSGRAAASSSLLLVMHLYDLSSLSQRWPLGFPGGPHQYRTYYIRLSPDL